MKHLTETVVVNCYGQTAEQFVADPDWRENFAGYQEEQARAKRNLQANTEALRKLRELQNGR